LRLRITSVIKHTLYIFRIVPLPINKGVSVVQGWCLYSNMCAVNCPYNASKMENVIKPCFNSVPLNICRGPGDILSSYITQVIRDISYCSRTLEIWYPIVSPIILIRLPNAQYLRESFTFMSTGMAWDLKVGLHNCCSIRFVMNWRFSIENLNLSRNSLSSKSNSICRYTLSFCCCLAILN